MPNRFVHRSLFVVATSLSVVAVGCGATGGATGSGADAGGPQIVSSGVAPEAVQAGYLAQAAQSTTAVSTAKVAFTVQTTPSGGDPSITVTSAGEVDAANRRAHLTAEVAGTVGGRSGDATIETIYDGDTVYVKAPFTTLLGGDRPWIKLTSPKLAELGEELAGQSADPDAFISLLEGAGGPVTTVGTEDVRGVPTRHVTVDLDVSKVLDQAAGERRQEIQDHLAQRGVSLDELAPLPAEAWIDDQGYVRRFTVSFDLSELGKLQPEGSKRPAPEATGVVTETVELYDFDEPADIDIPSASEVSTFDPSTLFGSGKGPGN